jgi:hypothetical protein
VLNNAGAGNLSQVASSTGLVGGAPPPVSDVVGNSVSFFARYAALVAADRESAGGTTSVSATHSYSITFTVDNPALGLYQVEIDTSRVGCLTLVDDSSGSASATLGAVTGLVDGVVNPTLALSAVGTLSGSGGGYVPFDQASTTLDFFDSASSRTFTLTFSWTSSASAGRDEASMRMGISGGITNASADDYPGVGPRVVDDDGHFVRVIVTLLDVPEPGSLLFVAAALVAMAARAQARTGTGTRLRALDSRWIR